MDNIHYGGIEAEKIEDFDAATFFIKEMRQTKEGDSADVWAINFLRAPEDVEFQKKSMGYKYTICLMNENLDVQVFDAILGDPVTYINNCMRSGEIGCVVKTSEWGSKLVELYQKIFVKGETANV